MRMCVLGRDQWLVSTLADMQSKLNTIISIVQRLSAERNQAPDLPSSVQLPVKTQEKLQELEGLLKQDSTVKDTLVRTII